MSIYTVNYDHCGEIYQIEAHYIKGRDATQYEPGEETEFIPISIMHGETELMFMTNEEISNYIGTHFGDWWKDVSNYIFETKIDL